MDKGRGDLRDYVIDYEGNSMYRDVQAALEIIHSNYKGDQSPLHTQMGIEGPS